MPTPGVLKALISGVSAGHVIAAVIGNKAPPEAARTVYRDWLAGWFSTDASRLKGFYRGPGAAAFA